MNNTQKYIGFFAAILNIIASALYWYAGGKQYVDQTSADTSTALALWFFLASLVLWVVYIGIALTHKSGKK